MKKQLALALFLLLSFTTFSQIKFEKGYFISNDNSKTECLIKNYDWDKNPSKINYKLNENDLPKEAAIEEIKEFSIDGISKYERFTVDIDMSSQDLNTMNKDRNPEWEKNIVFLKLLVEGNAKLYRYNNDNIPKYLFSVDSLEVKQLICKEYLTN
ncbi:MAG: tRNA modification GTPase, partial [Bacteroidota bacterium]